MNRNQADIDQVYQPSIRGGSVEYVTNMSNIENGCVSGLYLVKTSDECGFDQQTGKPNCRSIDVMQANKYDFNMQVHACNNGECEAETQCRYDMVQDGVKKYGKNAYGVNGKIISTDKEFKVKTEFVTDTSYKAVWKLKTTFTQENRSMVLEAKCRDYLSEISPDLNKEMGFIFSHWQDDEGVSGLDNSAGGDFVGCDAAKWNEYKYFKTMTWGSTENDDGIDTESEEEPETETEEESDEENDDGDTPDEDTDDGEDNDDDDKDLGEVICGGPAYNVDMCGDSDCTQCVEAWYEFKPKDIFFKCKSKTQYKYKNKCGGRRDLSLCGQDDVCHLSYPLGDEMKTDSPNAACRPIPNKLINNEFEFADQTVRNERAGLCRYGCQGSECRISWLTDDKRNGYSTMARCFKQNS